MDSLFSLAGAAFGREPVAAHLFAAKGRSYACNAFLQSTKRRSALRLFTLSAAVNL